MDSRTLLKNRDKPLKFEDLLYEILIKEFRTPEKQRELMYLLLMDNACKATKYSERKAWEFLASLLSVISRTKKIPSKEAIATCKATVNSAHRNKRSSSAAFLYSIEDIELSEKSVMSFISENAWEGMPGFGSLKNKMTASKVKIRKKQPDLQNWFLEKKWMEDDIE